MNLNNHGKIIEEDNSNSNYRLCNVFCLQRTQVRGGVISLQHVRGVWQGSRKYDLCKAVLLTLGALLFFIIFFSFSCVCVFFSCSCLGLFPFSSFSFIFLFSCNIEKKNSWPITNVIPLSSHSKTKYEASRITCGFHCHYSKTNINLPSVIEA